jgi:hypothetical protein
MVPTSPTNFPTRTPTVLPTTTPTRLPTRPTTTPTRLPTMPTQVGLVKELKITIQGVEVLSPTPLAEADCGTVIPPDDHTDALPHVSHHLSDRYMRVLSTRPRLGLRLLSSPQHLRRWYPPSGPASSPPPRRASDLQFCPLAPPPDPLKVSKTVIEMTMP